MWNTHLDDGRLFPQRWVASPNCGDWWRYGICERCIPSTISDCSSICSFSNGYIIVHANHWKCSRQCKAILMLETWFREGKRHVGWGWEWGFWGYAGKLGACTKWRWKRGHDFHSHGQQERVTRRRSVSKATTTWTIRPLRRRTCHVLPTQRFISHLVWFPSASGADRLRRMMAGASVKTFPQLLIINNYNLLLWDYRVTGTWPYCTGTSRLKDTPIGSTQTAFRSSSTEWSGDQFQSRLALNRKKWQLSNTSVHAINHLVTTV